MLQSTDAFIVYCKFSINLKNIGYSKVIFPFILQLLLLINQKTGNTMKHQFRCSFRYKLMTFVFLICTTLLVIVYFLSVYLLEPSYNRKIRQDLSDTLNLLVTTIDHADYPITTSNWLGVPYMSSEFAAELNRQVQDGELDTSGRCIEISTLNGTKIVHLEALASTCLLHEGKLISSNQNGSFSIDAELAQQMRFRTIREKEVTQYFENPKTGAKQITMGRLSSDGNYVVLISADLARIPQAAAVLSKQMAWVALGLLAVSLGGAWIFSTLFTRELTKVSNATKEMAHGNYNVRVYVDGEDEIADLANNFNFMASEVARSTQLQQDLIANISHDLRTPLTLIKGYAETIRDLTGDDPEKRNNQLTVIVNETDRLSGLVNSVMELSKIGSGTEKPQKVNFDLAQLCEEVAIRYENICQTNNYTLVVETEEVCMTYADPAMMERVLHNLLGNALHHIGEDGWLKIAAIPMPDGSCRVEISDHGCGIAKEDLPYIFDKYYRSRKDAGKIGTGLGLSITKAILQSHSFHFGVESTIGEGSTFWFQTLPL